MVVTMRGFLPTLLPAHAWAEIDWTAVGPTIAGVGAVLAACLTYIASRQNNSTAKSNASRTTKLDELELIQASQREYIKDLEGRNEDQEILLRRNKRELDSAVQDLREARADLRQARTELERERNRVVVLEAENERLRSPA